MNLDETAKVVAEIALYDNREVDPAVVAAWHRMIGDLDFADARAAVLRHFRSSTDYLKPAHIRELVKAARADRLRNSDLAVPAGDPTRPADWAASLRTITRTIGDGNTPGRAIGAAASEPTGAYRERRQNLGTRNTDRESVLRHRDLAAKLCEPPLNYERPDQWTGFVPPEHYDGHHNNSDRRQALAALVAEARRRDESAR